MEKVTTIIVAGGTGSRMGKDIKKQYILLKGKEVLAHTIEVFEHSKVVDEIIVVVGEEDIVYTQQLCERYEYNKVKAIVAGGKERQHSVYNGILAADEMTTYLMIHDGARPFVTEAVIEEGLEVAKEKGAAVVAVPVKDTIKICDTETLQVEETPIRQKLWAIQTPQIFPYNILKSAYNYVMENNISITDDSMAAEAIGVKVSVVPGAYTNIKITTPEDLSVAEAILKI